MTVERMREEVIDAYPGSKWKARVDRMTDSQVIATYHSLLDKKKIGREKRYYKPDKTNRTIVRKEKQKSRDGAGKYVQVSIDDLMKGVR